MIIVGVFFPGVSIPRGAEVKSAKVVFELDPGSDTYNPTCTQPVTIEVACEVSIR